MKRIALLTCLVSVLYAFREIPPFKQELAEKFYNLFQKTPKEKIYLHTDKEIYYAGEDIWFRAHQVDAATHIPHVISRILYVELTDKQDSILQRLKFMEWTPPFQVTSGYPKKWFKAIIVSGLSPTGCKTKERTIFSKKTSVYSILPKPE